MRVEGAPSSNGARARKESCRHPLCRDSRPPLRPSGTPSLRPAWRTGVATSVWGGGLLCLARTSFPPDGLLETTITSAKKGGGVRVGNRQAGPTRSAPPAPYYTPVIPTLAAVDFAEAAPAKGAAVRLLDASLVKAALASPAACLFWGGGGTGKTSPQPPAAPGGKGARAPRPRGLPPPPPKSPYLGSACCPSRGRPLPGPPRPPSPSASARPRCSPTWRSSSGGAQRRKG